MEDTSPPNHGSPTPTNTLQFSHELSYNSAAEDDFTDEVTSHALTPPPPPLKHPKTTSTLHNPDLISTFPDSILLHILSFLPAEHAVATALISKRWRRLWTAVPTLLFRLWSFRRGLHEFVSFVTQFLLLYSNSDIKKFHLDFDCAIHYQSRVYGWLHFATRHKVEELKLDLYKLHEDERYPGVYLYKLPQFIYRYGLLKKLNISYCDVSPSGSINWKFLCTLSISYAKLSDELLKTVLLGAPVLESLELYKCAGIRRLNVESASLRKLVVNDNWGDRGVLEISGRNLQSLRILGLLHEKHCRVGNVSGLVDVTLMFQLSSDCEVELDGFNYEEYQEMLREILENLRHVKKLTIGQWCIQGLGTSTSKEGKEYFNDLESHRKYFIWVDEQDGEAMELAFSKKKIEARKNWQKSLSLVLTLIRRRSSLSIVTLSTRSLYCFRWQIFSSQYLQWLMV